MMDLHSTCVSNSSNQIEPAIRELPEILRKKDIEINNLNKCNTELSETVVSLRQEIYALRKEKLNSEREWKESRSKLLMVSGRNAALVQELSKLNLENQKLKMEMLSLTKESCKPTFCPVGQADLPFNTYPWLFPTERSITPFLSSPIYQVGNSLKRSSREIKDSDIESYEEISQKLFAQMKMEMEEMDKQNCIESFSESEDTCESCLESTLENILNNKISNGENMCVEEIQKVEDMVSQLERELVSVKLFALEQNKFIRQMLQKVLSFTKAISSDSPSPGLQSTEKIISVHLNECSEEEVTDGRFQFPRPSDESFRAYFTQQLSSTQQPLLSGIHKSISEERLRTVQNVSVENSSRSVISHKGKTGSGGFRLADSIESENRSMQQSANEEVIVNNETAVKTLMPPCSLFPNKTPKNLKDESKTCPMCQAVFPKSTQEEFEAHVFSHFEAENSILENFEVIQY